jgi:hypothetical protein
LDVPGDRFPLPVGVHGQYDRVGQLGRFLQPSDPSAEFIPSEVEGLRAGFAACPRR